MELNKNKSVAIIGATCNLGIELSKIYAKNGFNLILISRNFEKNQNLKNLIKEKCSNIQIDTFELDILNIDNQKKIYNDLKNVPDGVISLVGETHNFDKILENKLFHIVNTNFLYLINFLSLFLNDFEKRNSGFLICLSSVSGVRGRAKNFIYGSAKAALTTFLSGCRNYYSNKNIFIMTVLPGFINNNQTKTGKVESLLKITPTDLANKIFKSHLRKKEVIYSSFIWAIIMSIIKFMPNKIFNKIKF